MLREDMPTSYITSVWLCKSDIDISSGHQMLFKNENEKIEYFTSEVRAIRFDDMMYISNKSGELKLDEKIVNIDGIYNYLIYINPNHENKYIICNIVEYKYVNDRVSSILYSIDNWQTYHNDIDFTQESFIARRHYHKNEGDKIRNLPYEDLDRGRNNVLASEITHRLNGDESYFIITLSNPIYSTFTGNHTLLYNSASTMSYMDDDNNIIKGAVDLRASESTIVFIVNYRALLYLTSNVFNTPEHVNKLQKITYIPFDLNLLDIKKDNQFNNATNKPDDNGRRKLYIPSPSTFIKEYTYDVFKNAKNLIRKSIHGDMSILTKEEIKDIPSHDLSAIELYLMRAPFTSLQVYDVSGNITEYDYKEVTNRQFDTIKLRVFGVLGIIPTIAYNVFNNDKYSAVQPLRQYHSTQLDFQSSVPNALDTNYIMPTESLSIVNDYTSAYLQANQNQINQQRANINTSFEMNINNINAEAQRGLAGSQLAYSNSALAKETEMINFGINQATQKTNHNLGMIGQGVNMGMSAIGNLAMGNVGGAASSLLSGGIGMGINNTQFNNSLNANSTMFNNSMQSSLQIDANNYKHQQSMINDIRAQNLRNNALQSRMSIDTLNARMLDVKNAPDSVSSLTGGSMMNMLFNRYSINMLTYTVHPHTALRLADYLAEYGMLSNTKEKLNTIFEQSEYGTFVQTVNANLKRKPNKNVPQVALLNIKEILDNGVFLWKDIENYRKTSIMKGI